MEGSAARRIKKACLSFQELRKEWKLFFNYWTASGREHWKPQYLELWSAGTHIHLGAFQGGGGNLTEGRHVSHMHTKRVRAKILKLCSHVIWLLTLYLHNINVHNCAPGISTVFDLNWIISITTQYDSCTVTVLKIPNTYAVETLGTAKSNTWAHL